MLWVEGEAVAGISGLLLNMEGLANDDKDGHLLLSDKKAISVPEIDWLRVEFLSHKRNVGSGNSK